MYNATSNPTLYKRYVDAAVAWAEATLAPLPVPINVTVADRAMQRQRDVLLAMGLRPNPAVRERILVLMKAVRRMKTTAEAEPACLDEFATASETVTIAAQQLAELGVGMHIVSNGHAEAHGRSDMRLHFYLLSTKAKTS